MPKEVSMARATTAERARVRPPGAYEELSAIQFSWSPVKVRRAGVALAASALPALLGCAASAAWLHGFCLAWLIVVACLLDALGRRADHGAVVLSVDRRGIFDRRLLPRRIDWQEIEGISPVNTERSF